MSPQRVVAEWLVLTALSTFAIILFQGLRPDLLSMLESPIFVAELAGNLALIVLAGLAATAFSFPDRAHTPLLKAALVAVFLGYSAIVLLSVVAVPQLYDELVNTVPHGLECLLCILSFAAVPAAWMFWRLRQLASTSPSLAGLSALLMATATGCLGVRLVEVEVISDGLIVWHYLPLWTFAALGWVFGRRALKW